METHSHGILHLYLKRTAGAHDGVRQQILIYHSSFQQSLWEKCTPTVLEFLFLILDYIWLAHIPVSALRLSAVYVSLTTDSYGMYIICMRHVYLSFNIYPVNIELALSVLSQKYNFV